MRIHTALPASGSYRQRIGSATAESVGPLSVAVEQLRRHAVVELQSREDAWRPFAAQIAQWLPRATQARKAAEPLAPHATRIWDQLKLQSNVSLDRIAPFRFIVIDDPVQSMDPARVDGLARVLQSAAKDRQVLVFTHDDRLHESLRRLAIDATVIEVTRSANSQVATRPALTPLGRYIADAMALAQDKDLSPDIARRVIPGLCRQALEAACMDAVRRRRIGKGESHQSVEELLLNAQKLTNLAALALFDDPERAGDVMGHLNRVGGPSTGDTFKACNAGAHGAFGSDPAPFVRGVEKLARWLVAQ
jgi:hypothetical protein